jgi:hypothetical protein
MLTHAHVDALCPDTLALQKQADGMDQEVSPNFSQAPFSVGGNEGRGHRRYLATATQVSVEDLHAVQACL